MKTEIMELLTHSLILSYMEELECLVMERTASEVSEFSKTEARWSWWIRSDERATLDIFQVHSTFGDSMMLYLCRIPHLKPRFRTQYFSFLKWFIQNLHDFHHTNILIVLLIFLMLKLIQSCLTLRDTVDCSPAGSSVHGILQARILEWVVMPSSGGSSWR